MGPIEWKLAVIEQAKMKAEIMAQKKAYKAQKKALPSQAVTYKHTHLGEMTGAIHFTKSCKVLPTSNNVFKAQKVLRPCKVEPCITDLEIVNL